MKVLITHKVSNFVLKEYFPFSSKFSCMGRRKSGFVNGKEKIKYLINKAICHPVKIDMNFLI